MRPTPEDDKEAIRADLKVRTAEVVEARQYIRAMGGGKIAELARQFVRAAEVPYIADAVVITDGAAKAKVLSAKARGMSRLLAFLRAAADLSSSGHYQPVRDVDLWPIRAFVLEYRTPQNGTTRRADFDVEFRIGYPVQLDPWPECASYEPRREAGCQLAPEIERLVVDAEHCLHRGLPLASLVLLGAGVEEMWHRVGDVLVKRAHAEPLADAARKALAGRLFEPKLVEVEKFVAELDVLPRIEGRKEKRMRADFRRVYCWADTVRMARNKVHEAVTVVPDECAATAATLMLSARTELGFLSAIVDASSRP